MTITITVDGTALAMDWQAQQTSNPADPVDLFVLNGDMTSAAPESTIDSDSDGDGDGADGKAKTKSSSKSKK